MSSTFETRLFAAAILAWTAVAVMNLVAGPPLGHDEAAFAIVARGDAVSWLYRSRGMVLVAELGVALGGAEWQLRLISMLLGLAVVPAVYSLGRAAFDARIGAWSAAVIAGAHPMASRSAELLGDLPAAAGILAGMAVLAGELGRAGGPRWRIVLAAPAFAAAFYLRYGSVAVIAIAGLAAAIVWWPAVRARPGRVAATSAVFAALLVPHAASSLEATGDVLGILRASAQVPRRAYWGDGIVTYVTANPLVYYGALVAPLAIAAVVGLARSLVRNLARNLARRPARDVATGAGAGAGGAVPRASWFLAAVAFGQLLALGIQTHAQPRYVFAATSILVILGVATVQPLARRRAALVAVAAAWLGLAIAIVPYQRATAHARSAITTAAAAIRGQRGAAPCVVVAGGVPQLTWYARCLIVPARWIEPATFAPGRERYIVSTPYAPLDGAGLAAAHGLTAAELPTGDPRARVWIIR